MITNQEVLKMKWEWRMNANRTVPNVALWRVTKSVILKQRRRETDFQQSVECSSSTMTNELAYLLPFFLLVRVDSSLNASMHSRFADVDAFVKRFFSS